MRLLLFLKELNRRHVVKAGIAYLIVAWLIVQVLSIFVPAFGLGQVWMKTTIIVLAVGFPIWLIIAWVYDFTPDGIKKTENTVFDPHISAKKNIQLNRLIIGGLSIALVLLIFNQLRLKNIIGKQQITASVLPEFSSSIAVLAFSDMSPEHNKEYFADGMSEEILNKLAKYKDLKVIGRTSSFSYKNREVTLSVIGKELDVAYILEGSVRQSGDLFRITVQLIDVATGAHIWSDTFDRKMEDVLTVQEEIAEIVAARMEVTLLNEDFRQRKLDPRAYELYLQAKQQVNKLNEGATMLADTLIRKSIELDDSYSPAWIILAQVIFGKTYFYFHIEPDNGYEAGILATEKAIELDSLNAMAYVWKSLFSWQNQEARVSADMLSKALNIAPNDPRILEQAGNFALRTNNIGEASKNYEKAILLDPKSTLAIKRKGFIEWKLGDLENAEYCIEKAYRLGLPDYFRKYELAMLNRDQGNYDKALNFMEQETNPYLKELLGCSINYAMGNKDKALQFLDTIKAYPETDNGEEYLDSDAEYFFEIACLSAYMNDKDQAFKYLDLAYQHVVIWPEWLFTMPEFNHLQDDPRWEQYVKRLGKAYDYNFLHVH